jgi:hypothetical protein
VWVARGALDQRGVIPLGACPWAWNDAS